MPKSAFESSADQTSCRSKGGGKKQRETSAKGEKGTALIKGPRTKNKSVGDRFLDEGGGKKRDGKHPKYIFACVKKQRSPMPAREE